MTHLAIPEVTFNGQPLTPVEAWALKTALDHAYDALASEGRSMPFHFREECRTLLEGLRARLSPDGEA